jgi:hypothetical protein
MVKINDDGRVHQSFVETHAAVSSGEVRFWPYDEGATLTELKRALAILKNNVYRKNVACNRYFSKLGRSFDSIFEDDTVWINWDPRRDPGFDGFTARDPLQEITISERAFKRKNVWFICAVIVHEFAHIAGAPGGWKSNEAERSLLHCGLGALFNPKQMG